MRSILPAIVVALAVFSAAAGCLPARCQLAPNPAAATGIVAAPSSSTSQPSVKLVSCAWLPVSSVTLDHRNSAGVFDLQRGNLALVVRYDLSPDPHHAVMGISEPWISPTVMLQPAGGEVQAGFAATDDRVLPGHRVAVFGDVDPRAALYTLLFRIPQIEANGLPDYLNPALQEVPLPSSQIASPPRSTGAAEPKPIASQQFGDGASVVLEDVTAQTSRAYGLEYDADFMVQTAKGEPPGALWYPRSVTYDAGDPTNPATSGGTNFVLGSYWSKAGSPLAANQQQYILRMRMRSAPPAPAAVNIRCDWLHESVRHTTIVFQNEPVPAAGSNLSINASQTTASGAPMILVEIGRYDRDNPDPAKGEQFTTGRIPGLLIDAQLGKIPGKQPLFQFPAASEPFILTSATDDRGVSLLHVDDLPFQPTQPPAGEPSDLIQPFLLPGEKTVPLYAPSAGAHAISLLFDVPSVTLLPDSGATTTFTGIALPAQPTLQ